MLPALIGLTDGSGCRFGSRLSVHGADRTVVWTDVCSADAGKQAIALTYDDGPNDPHTLRLLDVLAKHNVRATFFMIGRYVQQRPDIARAVAQAGHVIGNHTFTHPLLIFKSAAQTRARAHRLPSALQDAIGEHSNLFRPPFGGRRPATLRSRANLDSIP